MTNTNPTYKPFNLQEAMSGKPIVRRDGVPVKFVVYREEVTDGFPVVVIVGGSFGAYREDGLAYGFGTKSDEDLFMAPEKKKVWINVWKNKLGMLSVIPCHSEEEDERDRANPGGYTLVDSFTKEYDI